MNTMDTEPVLLIQTRGGNKSCVHPMRLGIITEQIAGAMVAYDPDATRQPANKATAAALK